MKKNWKEILKLWLGALLLLAESAAIGCKKLPKKAVALCLAAALVVAMVPAYVFAAETTYNVWVGGVQVTSANKDNIVVPDANGSAKYDPTTNTLTLNNFSYTNAAGVDAIISDGMNLTIVLKGENAFSVGGMGICVENGTLTISDSDEDDTVGSLEMISGLDAFAPAIYSGGSISIDGVELLAACDGASSTRTDPTFAIFSETVSIKDSTVTVRVLNVQNGLAIMASTLTVKNSTVEANGTYGAILDSATFSHSGVSGLVPTLNGDHVVYAGNDNTASSVGDDAKDDAATYANKYVKIEPVKYDLYIGGVQFTSGNLIIDSTDSTAISGSATYNPELNTLTLNNFQYSGPGYKNDEYEYLYGALRVEGDNDLRIVFTGQNVIECTNGDERWGLYTDFIGDLHIKAETIDSCLTFIGGDVACGRVPVFDGNFVIYAGDNEADAKITAEDTFASQYYTYSYVRYEPTLMVTFDYGTLGSETKTVFKDETVTPPAPAFAGKVLVGWYTDSNFTTEFNFSDAITANTTIYAKFADYEGDKAALKDAIDALKTAVGNVESALNNKVSTDKLTEEVGKLNQAIADAKTYADTQDAALKTTLEAADATMNAAITELQNRVTALETGLTTANGKIDTNTTDINTLKTNVSTLETWKTEAQNAITALQGLTNTQVTSISALQAAVADLQTAVSTANSNIAAAEAKIAVLEGKVTDLETATTNLQNAVTALQAAVAGKADTATVNAAIAELQTAINALETAKNNYVGADDALRTELEGKIATAKGEAISAAETLVNNAKIELQSKIDAKADAATTTAAIQNLQAAVAALEAVKDDYATADAALKTELEGKISAAQTVAISAAETLVNNAKAELTAAINNKADTATLNAKINELNTAIATAEATAKAYTDGAAAALTTAIATAKSEAVSAAETLVNNAKSELQSAIDTKADAATVNAAIANLQNAITALENAKDNYVSADAALKAELEAAITKAKQEAIDAAKGHIPYIGTNGNWWIGDTDTGVDANGIAGNKGDKGDTGADGVGVAKVEKTATNGNVDTYTITLTNGKTYTFTVTNGKDGVNGKDGENGKDGADGKDGENGKDGLTPFIGENGNWWIGDTDTGVKAVAEQTAQKGTDTITVVSIVVASVALLSNLALVVWIVTKKKKVLV